MAVGLKLTTNEVLHGTYGPGRRLRHDFSWLFLSVAHGIYETRVYYFRPDIAHQHRCMSKYVWKTLDTACSDRIHIELVSWVSLYVPPYHLNDAIKMSTSLDPWRLIALILLWRKLRENQWLRGLGGCHF
jgi:hypothetical protein